MASKSSESAADVLCSLSAGVNMNSRMPEGRARRPATDGTEIGSLASNCRGMGLQSESRPPFSSRGDYGADGTAHGAFQAGSECRDIRMEASDYIDGDLHESQVERVRAHLGGCDGLPGVRRHARRNYTASGDDEARGTRSGRANGYDSRQDRGGRPPKRLMSGAIRRRRTSTGT